MHLRLLQRVVKYGNLFPEISSLWYLMGKLHGQEEFNMEMKLKVLISDDDKEFCSRCTSTLRSCGFDTSVAPKDGQLMLEMIREITPDIVLMDVFMPYLFGKRVCRCQSSWLSLPTAILCWSGSWFLRGWRTASSSQSTRSWWHSAFSS